MSASNVLYSPKQVALALGVSESSVKRWCDKGRIRMAKTTGGHRRIRSTDIVEFVRQTGHGLLQPDTVGLTALKSAFNEDPPTLQMAVDICVEALLAGDEQRFQTIVSGLYLNRHSVSQIFDLVIAPTFHQIGIHWKCEKADVYQERRSCEICTRTFNLMMKFFQPQPQTSIKAIGGTLSGDNYTLPTMMAEIVLRDSGFHSSSLGVNIPAASYVQAIRDINPRLLWLSVSHVEDQAHFLHGFKMIAAACREQNVSLVVGGRSLDVDLRKSSEEAAYCETMTHLQSLAHTIHRNSTKQQASEFEKQETSLDET